MSRIGRTVLGLLVAVACVVAPAGAATAATATDEVACEVTYVPHPHTGGFNADIFIRNTGTVTIYGWTLSFPLDEGVEIIDMWNAVLISPSVLITAENEQHNGDVAPDTSIYVGFLATGTAQGVPSWFTVNGVSCAVNG
jgi:hypothetical protein